MTARKFLGRAQGPGVLLRGSEELVKVTFALEVYQQLVPYKTFAVDTELPGTYQTKGTFTIDRTADIRDGETLILRPLRGSDLEIRVVEVVMPRKQGSFTLTDRGGSAFLKDRGLEG